MDYISNLFFGPKESDKNHNNNNPIKQADDKPRLNHSEPKKVHGFLCDETWPLPVRVTESNESNRADQGNHTMAHEYLDEEDVLDHKIDILIDLLKKSKFCGAYTGAGLSRASGIPDYATKSQKSIVNTPQLTNSGDAQPTYAHCILTALYKAGFIKWYVQQNHDGLPQKSGFPQAKINEIHGAWFDPSNPVVQFSGNLRGDLFQEMLQYEQKADLCLTLGTSLSGMNADRMASTPARKSISKELTSDGHPVLGTVLINIQETPLDAKCALRIWAKIDDAFSILAKKLAIKIEKQEIPKFPKDLRFTLPYDEKGRLSAECEMELDLNPGAEIMIPVKGAENEGRQGKVWQYNPIKGVWTCELYEKSAISSNPHRLAHRMMGWWWITEAQRGEIAQLPVINLNPKVKKLR